MPGARETIRCGAGMIFILRPVSSVTVPAPEMLTKHIVNTTAQKHTGIRQADLKLNGEPSLHGNARHGIIKVRHAVLLIIQAEGGIFHIGGIINSGKTVQWYLPHLGLQ